MNRRKFLKNIFGLLSLIPFISIGKDKSLVLGTDKEAPKSDVIGLAIYDDQKNLVDTYIFDEPLSDYRLWANCKCELVELE